MGSKNKDTTKKTSIGGQALIEGIMMKGVSKGAMAVRLPDGSIDVEDWDIKPKKWYNKCPVIRGSINFVQQLREGYSCLMKSADKSGMMDDDSEEEQSKFEKWLDDKFGDKLTGAIMAIAMVIGIALAVFLFLLLPSFLGGFVPKDWGVLARNVLEGIVRIAIFLMFMWSVSHMKDIRRTFEYHGAEHKTIFCYEAGEELTVENVRKQGRFHPRCGTSFMFVLIIIATIVSSIVFSIIDITNPFLRMLAHLILLPLVVGISYEFNRYAGRSESVISRALRWPGLMIQHLTVFEPDDSMIEVAITAMKEVIPDDGSDEW